MSINDLGVPNDFYDPLVSSCAGIFTWQVNVVDVKEKILDASMLCLDIMYDHYTHSHRYNLSEGK